MKALTLTQPWATLVAEGEKWYETRSWAPPHRGLLAIAAGKGLGPIGGERALRDLIQQEPFDAVLRRHLSGYTVEERAANLPRGCIVALAVLSECRSTVDVAAELARRGSVRELQEVAFGDYGPGRWAWLLSDVVALDEPVECRGALGVWTVPADVEATIRARYPVYLANREGT